MSDGSAGSSTLVGHDSIEKILAICKKEFPTSLPEIPLLF